MHVGTVLLARHENLELSRLSGSREWRDKNWWNQTLKDVRFRSISSLLLFSWLICLFFLTVQQKPTYLGQTIRAAKCCNDLQDFLAKESWEWSGRRKGRTKNNEQKNKAATRLLELIIYRSLLPTLYRGLKATCSISTYNFHNDVRGYAGPFLLPGWHFHSLKHSLNWIMDHVHSKCDFWFMIKGRRYTVWPKSSFPFLLWQRLQPGMPDTGLLF